MVESDWSSECRALYRGQLYITFLAATEGVTDLSRGVAHSTGNEQNPVDIDAVSDSELTVLSQDAFLSCSPERKTPVAG